MCIRDSTVTANPSLVSGATLTINWIDVNAGAKAVSSLWYDQLIVFNTTTGVTLTSQLIQYDPAANGNTMLAPGGTLARSVTYKLPDGISGTGTLTVTLKTD